MNSKSREIDIARSLRPRIITVNHNNTPTVANHVL